MLKMCCEGLLRLLLLLLAILLLTLLLLMLLTYCRPFVRSVLFLVVGAADAAANAAVQ